MVTQIALICDNRFLHIYVLVKMWNLLLIITIVSVKEEKENNNRILNIEISVANDNNERSINQSVLLLLQWVRIVLFEVGHDIFNVFIQCGILFKDIFHCNANHFEHLNGFQAHSEINTRVLVVDKTPSFDSNDKTHSTLCLCFSYASMRRCMRFMLLRISVAPSSGRSPTNWSKADISRLQR